MTPPPAAHGSTIVRAPPRARGAWGSGVDHCYSVHHASTPMCTLSLVILSRKKMCSVVQK
jgi:hypothetical protein